MSTETDWEEVTAEASERAGYAPDVWRTASEVVRAAVEADRERYERSAELLKWALEGGTDLDAVLRRAEHLLHDLNMVSEGVDA